MGVFGVEAVVWMEGGSGRAVDGRAGFVLVKSVLAAEAVVVEGTKAVHLADERILLAEGLL